MNPDRVLVDAVLAKAPGAFERLMREYQGLCWHIIQRMVRHPEDARELCQETFLRVHLNLHQYRCETALKYWIGRVAYSIALRHLERRRVRTGVLLEEGDPAVLPADEGETFDFAAALDDDAAARRLHALVDALPPVQRMLLTLYHFDEMTIPEIASLTGLPNGTIKSHLFRTRLHLREMLEARSPGTLP